MSAALGAFMKNPKFREWAQQIDADTLAQLTGGDVMNPMQQPNYTGNDPISNAEAFGVNELFRSRNDQGFDTLRSLRNVGFDREQQVARARNEAGQSADVTAGIFNRRTEGMNLSDRQKAGAKQRLSLNRAVTEAAAATGTRQRVATEQRQADQAATGFEDIIFGQQVSGLSNLASAEGARKTRIANEKAAKKSSRNSMLGTLGGLAIGVASLFGSSETFKTTEESSPRLLDKLNKVRIDKWKYHGGDRDHIGPYAEEFNQTFGVGKNHEKYLDVVDVLGVTLGSIKELNDKVERALA